MTVSLTDSAPVEEEAVTPVGEVAPPSESAVENVSVPEGFIPVSRFNGLMSSHQRTLAELENLRTEVEALRSNPQEAQVPESDTELRSQVEILTDLLLQERADNARSKALEKYPLAREWSDLLVGDNPQDVLEAARVVHERMERLGYKPGESTTTETVEEPAPAGEAPSTPVTPAEGEAPVVIPGSTQVSEQAVIDKVQDALKRKDFAAFLAARREQTLGTPE